MTPEGWQDSGMSGLSEREAFEALTLFLSQYYERAGDDMATLMADITIQSDGGTLDPAAWDDWLRCVREVEGRREH